MSPDQNDRAAQDGGVYLEFVRLGNAVRVNAVDAATGIETFITGPLNAPRVELERLAVARLKRLLSETDKPSTNTAGPKNKTPPVKGRGVII